MSLIEINIPETEGWQDNIATRILFLMLGAILMRLGLRMWAATNAEGLVAAIPTTLCFALGVQIAIFAAADIDFEEHGRLIGYGITVALTLLTIVMMLQTDVIPRLNADVLAFTSYGVEVAAEGGNPFAASMAPSAELPGSPDHWTYRTDGSRVTEWSYPGGTLWVYGLQFLSIGRDPIGIRLTSILGVGLVSALVVYWLPAQFAPAGPLSLSLAQNEWMAAAGGLNDMWWVLFVAVSLVFWARDRRVLAAAALGVAMAMKQQAWPIGFFLAIWVWRERESFVGFGRDAVRYGAAGLATFIALNMPWLVMDPVAWAESVFVPLGAGGKAPLESTGVGIASLNTAVGGMIGREAFDTFVLAIVGLTGLGYWYFFDRIRWLAWGLPAVVLLFAPRSLPSYFHWFVPVFLLAFAARHGIIRGQSEVSAA